MRRFASLAFVIVCLAGLTAAAESKSAEKFVPLFNGKNLDGWEGDTDVWYAEGGEIVGSSESKKLTKNAFLVTKKHYKNFILKVKFKFSGHNSGVQFRSQIRPDGVVTGYQADIADNDSMGQLWDEEGRGQLARLEPAEIGKYVHANGWNDYVITADGPHITMTLNGFQVVDYAEKDDQAAAEGIIALQVHSGPAMNVHFKDIEIAELP